MLNPLERIHMHIWSSWLLHSYDLFQLFLNPYSYFTCVSTQANLWISHLACLHFRLTRWRLCASCPSPLFWFISRCTWQLYRIAAGNSASRQDIGYSFVRLRPWSDRILLHLLADLLSFYCWSLPHQGLGPANWQEDLGFSNLNQRVQHFSLCLFGVLVS